MLLSRRQSGLMLFLSVALVLWKCGDILNNVDEKNWPVILACLDSSAGCYVNENTKGLCFVLYLSASPDNPAVHGHSGEPPVYS